jgi:hypothetical protein
MTGRAKSPGAKGYVEFVRVSPVAPARIAVPNTAFPFVASRKETVPVGALAPAPTTVAVRV